jgi:hypothetical protein
MTRKIQLSVTPVEASMTDWQPKKWDPGVKEEVIPFVLFTIKSYFEYL